MPDTALAQLRRILALIPELADDRSHPIDGVARRLGVDRATLLRDLRFIADRYDDPGGFVEGVNVFIEPDQVAIRSSHFLRPMRLNAAELCALELGLGMLRGERPAEEHRAIDGARTRLREVIARMPAGPDDPIRHATTGAPVDASLLALVRRAIAGGRKVRLTYRGGGEVRSLRRTACPYGLVFTEGMWYLVAHCERREGLRIFRVDRIEEAELAEGRFTRPADFSLDTILRDGKAFRAEAPRTLTVRYSPKIAAWIAERVGRPLEPDGSLTLDLPLADPDWAVRHVLQYGPEAEVLAPEDVRAELRRRLRRLLAGEGS